MSIVGDRWTVCSEPDFIPKPRSMSLAPSHGQDTDSMFATDYTYLGYSLDTSNIPQPPAHRSPKIWVLAKRVFYFTDGAQPVWNNDWYAQVSDMLQEEFPGFEFVGSFVDDRNEETKKLKGPIEVPKGIRNLVDEMGPLNSEQWDEQVSQCRGLLGIGWPPDSPSPYRTMAMVCLRRPFARSVHC
jgi:hypothetical protein